MRKLVIIAAAVGALALGPLAPAGASSTDPVQGPPCSNITLSSPGMGPATNPPPNNYTVGGAVSTAAPSCTGEPYQFMVVVDPGTADQTTVTQTKLGDGVTTTFRFSVPVFSSTGNACVSAVSYYKGHLADSAPNTGCVPVTYSASGGGFWN